MGGRQSEGGGKMKTEFLLKQTGRREMLRGAAGWRAALCWRNFFPRRLPLAVPGTLRGAVGLRGAKGLRRRPIHWRGSRADRGDADSDAQTGGES